jgi:phospho-N-acetylmuramoyl-pentapeptide-transferase
MALDVLKVFIPAIVAFSLGIALTPLLTHYLFKYKAWKKKGGKTALDGTEAIEFNKLHKTNEVKTPRMGGIVIWASTLITILFMWSIAFLIPHPLTEKLDFLSRDQTWIPLLALMVGALTGLVNDILDVTTDDARGLSIGIRLGIVSVVSLFISWWFYAKLDVHAIGIPFHGPFEIGWLIIPLFIVIALFIYASGVIDGIDGLSGGVFASIFAAYAGVAFFQDQINLAAFAATISGATLAFLWFNIPPARFWMTETGTFALTFALAVVAFMTDTLGDGHGLLALFIIGFPLVATVFSNIIQIASKKFRQGEKVFKVAPLHHHFEALGWPSYKVTMRYWILSIMFAIVGVAFALIG